MLAEGADNPAVMRKTGRRLKISERRDKFSATTYYLDINSIYSQFFFSSCDHAY
jgi:hypothetical protein